LEQEKGMPARDAGMLENTALFGSS
jgi:hypothetical protein